MRSPVLYGGGVFLFPQGKPKGEFVLFDDGGAVENILKSALRAFAGGRDLGHSLIDGQRDE
mgnify:CR=1 FL=1